MCNRHITVTNSIAATDNGVILDVTMQRKLSNSRIVVHTLMAAQPTALAGSLFGTDKGEYPLFPAYDCLV